MEVIVPDATIGDVIFPSVFIYFILLDRVLSGSFHYSTAYILGKYPVILPVRVNSSQLIAGDVSHIHIYSTPITPREAPQPGGDVRTFQPTTRSIIPHENLAEDFLKVFEKFLSLICQLSSLVHQRCNYGTISTLGFHYSGSFSCLDSLASHCTKTNPDNRPCLFVSHVLV